MRCAGLRLMAPTRTGSSRQLFASRLDAFARAWRQLQRPIPFAGRPRWSDLKRARAHLEDFGQLARS